MSRMSHRVPSNVTEIKPVVREEKLETNGTTLHGARNLRMRHKPSPFPLATKGINALSKSQNLSTAQLRRKAEPLPDGTSFSRKGKEKQWITATFGGGDESEDELLLSDTRGSSVGSPDSRSTMTPRVSQRHTMDLSVDGLPYHEAYKPKRLPNFKKKSKQTSSSSTAAVGESASQPLSSQTEPGPSSVQSSTSLSKIRTRSGPRPAYIGDKLEKAESLSTSINRPAGSGILSKVDHISIAIPGPAGDQEIPCSPVKKRKARPHPSVHLQNSPGSTTPRPVGRRKPQSVSIKSSKIRTKAQSSPVLSTSAVKKTKVQPFPLSLSNVASGSKCRSVPSPKDDDIDSDKENKDGDEDEDDDLLMTSTDRILVRGGPQPFPIKLSTMKELANSGLRKRPSNERDLREFLSPGKSGNPGDTNEGADSSLTLAEALSDLCPYCDEPFPADPSGYLQSMLERLRLKSRLDPRPCNPRGLKAPLVAFVTFCQRHRFESHHLPLAKLKGWPTSINFSSLPKRVFKLRTNLEKVIHDKHSSQFWKDLLAQIKTQGTSNAVGVRGQYTTFDKVQPGYYGEQGSMIISQTLYDLFPPASFDPESISPLTATDFIQRVLIPEVGVALICEDLNKSKEDAIAVLRESTQYGVAMFPDLDHGGVGEELAKKRALKRRKEIEEEEEEDEEVKSSKGQQISKVNSLDNSKRRSAGKRKISPVIGDEPTDIEGDLSDVTNNSRKSTWRKVEQVKKSNQLEGQGSYSSNASESSKKLPRRPKPACQIAVQDFSPDNTEETPRPNKVQTSQISQAMEPLRMARSKSKQLPQKKEGSIAGRDPTWLFNTRNSDSELYQDSEQGEVSQAHTVRKPIKETWSWMLDIGSDSN